MSQSGVTDGGADDGTDPMYAPRTAEKEAVGRSVATLKGGVMANDNRALIESALQQQGVTAADWREGEDGLEAVLKERWGVVEDNEEKGLYTGDEGEVTACVVGAPEHRNQRVCFSFTPEGYDGGSEVLLFDDVEPVG